ncbi:MAG: CPXCG motif-containing cysteine-rich protein [Mariprofundaceae bacterium]
MESVEIVEIQCPCCGELIEITVERAMAGETCGESCPVCCQPMVIDVRLDDAAAIRLSARREND